jgi:hypothetical protein
MSFKGHPNIILFMGGYRQGSYSYIVTELAKKGNVQTYLKKQSIGNGNSALGSSKVPLKRKV